MKNRINFCFIIFCLLFGVVVAKSFYIQVINQKKLLAYSQSQFVREVKEFPNRGNILDRNDNPLAINVQSYNIATIPKKKSDTFINHLKALSQIVPELKFKELWAKVKNREKYTWMARDIKLTEEQLKKIKKLEPIYVEKFSRRIYPNHELLSQILGFVGRENTGLAGIELSMNEELRGQAQTTKYLRDAKGRPVKFESEHMKNVAQDIVLSIDKDIQSAAETYLKEAVLYHKALRGGVGVMDAETGEIIAMANYPTFDSNNAQNSPNEHRKLAFVTDPFEPGSIFKTITIASALENKVADADKKYFCEYGKLRVQNHTISEAESDHRFEWLTVSDILKYSSNVGTTKIAFDLKYPKLKQTIKDFGYGEKTGIEIGGESKGIFNPGDKVKPLTLSNISFGHGIATTAIQMLSAYATIANGGYKIAPTIFKNENSMLVEEKRILATTTAKALSKMLVKAVEDGTGTNAKIPHYLIAGKTGTAQRVSPRGGYEGYVASFAGFPVNVNKPFVVMVYIDNPKANGYYGGMAAAPVFKKLTQYILYKKKDFSKMARMPDKVQEKPMTEKMDQLLLQQSSKREMAPGKMPNFIGLDKASALQMATTLNMQIEMTGFGIVAKQYPAVGDDLALAKTLELRFEPPRYDE